MTSFTRANLAALRTDIDAALATVATKHGVLVSLGNCRFTEKEARFSKLIIAPKVLATNTTLAKTGADPYGTLASREYLNLAYMFALPVDGLGKTFSYGGSKFKVIGLKASRRKYPVIGEGVQGGKYKFTAETVRAGLAQTKE